MLPEGFRYGAALGAAAVLIGWLAGPVFAAPLVAAALFTLYFFRDPERTVPAGEGLVVSPADGRLVEVRRVEHEGRPRTQVSIFLSPLDVHVNRSPAEGVIREVRYSPGRFHAAWRREASLENERNTVTLESPGGEVVFKQISGVLARRIVFWKKSGERVERGERIGLMKFGSRVDVLLDPAWELAVVPGQRVLGGSSVLARQRPGSSQPEAGNGEARL